MIGVLDQLVAAVEVFWCVQQRASPQYTSLLRTSRQRGEGRGEEER
jgi:hypothetical protein